MEMIPITVRTTQRQQRSAPRLSIVKPTETFGMRQTDNSGSHLMMGYISPYYP